MSKHVIFEKLLSEYRVNKLSHAILLVTNNIDSCYKDLSCFLKKISCPEEYNEACSSTCNVCRLIDNQELSDIVTITPENNNIRKECIINLKTLFTKKANYIKNKIYIINYADKMNVSSSNSLLKFFEEPEPNILGFLITNNKDKILPTILSRCEIISVIYDSSSDILTTDEISVYDDLAKQLVMYLETKPLVDYFMYKNNIIEKIDTKEKLLYVFQKISFIYSQALNNVATLDNDLKKLAESNSINKLVKKLKIIDNINRCINYNVNVELIIDKFCIEMVDLNG